jgi:ribosomal protein S4
MDKREYLIDNPSCTAPFSVEVLKDVDLMDYSISVKVLGKTYTRVLEKRLDAIIIAKDIARALEDAFRHTYEDKSESNDSVG